MADPLHLTSLAISGFRGIRQPLEIGFGRRLTILYGGNATGKSSIAQAVEFVLSGQVLDHEDNPIAGRYLSNALDSKSGRVVLRLTDGHTPVALSAVTDESRTAIENRFRHAGAVDWPEKQRVPVTTTHITSQGTLARVLAAESVTRNDLSGLCAGAYLRSLLTRATRLADVFRQAATGRNIQAAIKEARDAFEAARVLYESLSASGAEVGQLAMDPSALLRQLASELALPEVMDIGGMVHAADQRLDEAERKLAAIQRLLARMRDLGQYEVELKQLQSLVERNVATDTDLQSKREEADTQLARLRSREHDAMVSSTRAAGILEASERHQRALSLIGSLEARLAQARESREPLMDRIASLRAALADAATEAKTRSDALVRLAADQALAESQLRVVSTCFSQLIEVPESLLVSGEAEVRERERTLKEVQEREAIARQQLQEATASEAAAEMAFRDLSESDARFLAAVAELESFIRDDACSLCGHRHGSRTALDAAIQAVKERRLSGSSGQREAFERATADRRDRAALYAVCRGAVKEAEAELAKARDALARVQGKRKATLDQVREALTRQGLQASISQKDLASLRDELAMKQSRLQQELLLARPAEEESRQTRSDLERELAARDTEAEQVKRLAQELSEQIGAARRALPPAVSHEDVLTAPAMLAAAEGTLIEVQVAIARASAELADHDRLLAEARAQRAGAQLRLDAIAGLLRTLDAELREVGATREVTALLNLESEARQHRDRSAAQKSRALRVRQELEQLDRYRARIEARQQLQAAEVRLAEMQQRQSRSSQRAAQFAQLRDELERAQNTTAEAVLKNVHDPVRSMFRAMTAGCQWDIQFVLTESGSVEPRLVDGRGAAWPASAILNSAYLNVSAIALRIALASQQNWTTLRTIVLDDPILEMDSLTQSALIDGLEAIIASRHPPWMNMQLIVTTWSEDFAVLAAHKLAHLNGDADDEDDFLIYRLESQVDGTVVPERHAPRWKKQATAA